ncbi:divergent polysaccharide deacetylase family protein [Tropicimonas isoalkanivorans]|uniref:Uncharacterized conserved protein YibQ, putative polysaccharide deacetylase 2 family n=1 Tax=Tropicimonas isoalkanivorans TaxID=441112 RepID=A0A1I1E030_9RHOB|nr:divergent polysaccharide deacetylase family protein [Tropicimonas isoalkanivorans]SFB80002.1 Uncharacterized conserved protein YibQ, putative polysaccharide deacetylase 2 family [Tropicimonas isoalkanivorans]
MGRGILSGLFWGSIISVVVLSAVSLLAPPLQRTALLPEGDGQSPALSDTAGKPGPEITVSTPEGTPAEGEAPAVSESGAPVAQPEGPETGGETEIATTGTEPEGETAPEPDAAGSPDAETGGTGTEVASTLSVPAGSEFRRPPPETEAALPAPDAGTPGKSAPPVPQGFTGDPSLAIPNTSAAARPETPGMEVTAPEAPGFDDKAPEIGAETPTEPGLKGTPSPSEPGAPAAREDVSGQGVRRFAPPVTAESVGSETATQANVGAAERLASGATGERLSPGESQRVGGTDAAGVASTAVTGSSTSQPAESTATAPVSDGAAERLASGATGERLSPGESPRVEGSEVAGVALMPGATPVPGASAGQTADRNVPEPSPELTAATAEAVAVAPIGRVDGGQPIGPTGAETTDSAVAAGRETVASATAREAVPSVASTAATQARAVDGMEAVEADVAEAAPTGMETTLPAANGTEAADTVQVSDAPDAATSGLTVPSEPGEGLDAVVARSNGPVAGGEPADTAEGERVAMADVTSAMPQTTQADRAVVADGAEDADEAESADALPAAPAVAASPAETDLERPERKEVTIAGPEEAPPSVNDRAPDSPGVRVVPLTERSGSSSRLPQIGDAEVPEAGEEEAGTADAAQDGETAIPSGSGGSFRLDALSRNAVPFENAPGKPLYSIILIDDGSRTLDRSVLGTFNFPVTFAVDPTMPDASEAAAFYRENGFEVVMLVEGLPENAQPRDLEVALEANFAQVPEAVAIMDPPENGFGNSRNLVEHVASIAAYDGHGLIGWDRGVGSVQAAAERIGQPSALVFRSLDDQGERNTVIERYLDRAAFKARQEGAVVMAGHARPETVKALFEWVGSDKASDVTLAPVSAVLRGQ